MTLVNTFLVLVVLARLAFAQAEISSGAIDGTVVDTSGGVIPGVLVTVSDEERGLKRSASSDENGRYSFAALPPREYELRFETDGFGTKIVKNVDVRIGEVLGLTTKLDLSTVATEISVTAEPPVVDRYRTQQATTIETKQISDLPINQRSYLDFALLAPGVVDTTNMADDSDFRVAQTPQSGLSFGGSNGRGNIFAIDGAEHYSNSGGVRPSVSQEGVREFQINQNSFSAELGGGFGGAVNIVTKSGTNEVHGSLFGFLRHRSIQARNYFDPAKSAFTRGQYGASIGAPIRKNKTFLFGAFERLDRHETSFVPILQSQGPFFNVTNSQEELLSFLEASGSPSLGQVAKQLRGALTPAHNPDTLKIFRNNSGTFPFSGAVTTASFRLDHQVSDYHNIFLRGSHAKDRSDNTDFGALIGASRGRAQNLTDSTIVLSDTYIFNPRWLMETRGMFSYGIIEVEPSDTIGPELNINGFGFFGRDIFLPSKTIERHWQLRQTFSYVGGKNTLKFGFDINPVKDVVNNETFFGGRFGFGEAVPLSALINASSGDPQASDKLGLLLGLLGRPDLVTNLEDPINSLQAFSLELPIFYQQGFGNPNWTGWSKRFNFFVQDTYRPTPRFSLNLGLRYELEVNEKILGTDSNNFGPRVGFAWTPFADQKTVIRGGAGFYYSQINIQIANVVDTLDGQDIAQVFVPLTGIPGVDNPITGQPLTSADIYQTLNAQGILGNRTITTGDLEQFGIQVGPNLPLQVLFGADSNYANPLAYQGSFQIERAFSDYAVSAGYSFVRGLRLPKSLDRNVFKAGQNPDGTPIYGFRNPLIFQYNFYESTANSSYHALTLRVSKRMRKNFALDAHYTFSKAIDEVTDFNSDFQPQDQLNARAEKSLSPFHRRHRLVANAVVESGWSFARDKSFAHNLFADWSFSPIVVASSRRPFNLLVGFDNVGDRHPNTHRPHGAGRDIGQGPNFFTLDFRLKRTFKFGPDGRRNVEFLAEAFNTLNRTNFKSLNNIVGDVTIDQVPRPIVGNRGATTDPLAFTSALNPRQFQFGIRFNF